MDKLKYIRIQQENDQYSGDIPIGADAQNIDFTDGYNLQEFIGNYDYTKDGSIKDKFDSIQEDFDNVLGYDIITTSTEDIRH